MRSRRRARSRLWVAISAARPVRRTRSSSVSITLSPVAWSRLPVGSSASRISGSLASARPVPGARAKADAVEQFRRLAARAAARDARDHLRQHDVFERRKFRQQVMKLVDEPDMRAPQQCPPLFRQTAAILAADQHRTAVCALEQARNMQQCRFAGAGRTDQCCDFARIKRQIDAIQDPEFGSGLCEDAADPPQLERRGCHLRVTRSAGLRPGRAGRRARKDKAWQGRKA